MLGTESPLADKSWIKVEEEFWFQTLRGPNVP